MTSEKIGLKIVRAIDRATDIAIELILCVALLFGVYSLWDSRQVYRAADASNYTAYRPTSDDPLSFEELRRINPEVFAWLTVNDTPIDYPVAQSDNNEKYINYNAEGQYSLSGSLFLDYRNSPDFDDFNSIIYGHHMEKKLMFGSLSDFADKDYFYSHPYGNLYFNGEDHGLEFFAIVLTDAYDSDSFSPGVEGDGAREKYLDLIFSAAEYTRDIDVSEKDQIVLLSTCTTSITNGRYMLVGKLTDELHPQPVKDTEKSVRIGSGIEKYLTRIESVPLWLWIMIIVTLVGLLVLLRVKTGRKRPEK